MQHDAHHVWPARLMPVATGWGWPSELYTAEIGPALMLASQIMISLTFAPVGVDAVNRSYAMSATMVPVVVCDHVHVD